MRVAVLGSPQSWYVKDLQRAAQTRHQIVPLPFSRIHSHLDQSQGPRLYAGSSDLSRFDCILVRTMPPGSLEQIVFRMDALGQWHAAGCPVVNAPRALEAAVDKYLALAKLQSAGLLIPQTRICQSAEDAMHAFQQLGGDVVIKPLFGSEGRGITRITDPALAERAFKMLSQLGAVIYLQKHIEHEGYDFRLLVIGRQVLAIRRINPRDWRTNVSRGAVAQPLEVDSTLRHMAHRAADALGAELAGVDLLPGRDGQVYAIEVNAVPGWKALSESLHIDVSSLVIQYLESVVAAGDGR